MSKRMRLRAVRNKNTAKDRRRRKCDREMQIIQMRFNLDVAKAMLAPGEGFWVTK